MTALLARGVRAFGRFWWDFLIGDTPELALATGVIVGPGLPDRRRSAWSG